MSRLPFRCVVVLSLLATVLAAVPALVAQGQNRAATNEKIIKFVRGRFSIPAAVKITMTELRETIYPDFLETTITLDDGKQKRDQPLFVSKDMRYMVQGNLFNLNGDPRDEIKRLISLPDQPMQGSADAPVTLVEYADLECPVCAQMHDELESTIVPKWGDKLRVVFKEYPLTNIHEWAYKASIAAQCVYQIDPSTYVAFRTAVYKNQEAINAEHLRDMLLHLGAEAGVDNVKLAACFDSEGSKARVDADMREGDALGVAQTPTSFINGRVLVGAPVSADFDKVIEESLKDPR